MAEPLSGFSSLRNKFSNSSINKGGETKNETNDQPRRNVRAKANPLLTAVTDFYVDDTTLYKPRIGRSDRFTYWSKLQELNLPKKPQHIDEESWLGIEAGYLNQRSVYPKFHQSLLKFVTSNYWDQLYLNFFILWLLLIIFVVDGWADSVAPFILNFNFGNIFFIGPPLLMFLTQIPPLCGTIFLMHYGNDLMHHVAGEHFQSWAFVSCLLSQYIEYFYYGGRGRRNDAGKCGIGHAQLPTWRIKAQQMVEKAFRISKGADAKIHAGDETDKVDTKNEDGDEEKGTKSQSKKDVGEKNGSNSSDSENDSDDDENSGGGSDSGSEKSSKHSSSNSDSDSEEDSDDDDSDKDEKGDEEKGESGSSASEGEEKEAGEGEEGQGGEKGIPLPALRAPGHLLQDVLGADFLPRRKDPEDLDPKTEFLDWTCMVCCTENHRPKVSSDPGWNISFGERGKYLKQTFTIMNQNTSKPICKKCFTVYDYAPPPATAHLFEHNPEPHVAFQQYPPTPKIPHGLNPEKNPYTVHYIDPWKSFFFGTQNHPQSKMLFNDWMLRKWIRDVMPEIPRYKLKPGEHYEIGEIVECRLQKSEFNRARVFAIRKNFTYDIRYDTSDEVRFVDAKHLRLGFQKGSYAYRVELGMAVLWIAFPLTLLLSVNSDPKSPDQSYGNVFIAPLLVSLILLVFRLVNFVQYVVNFKHAGCWVIFRTIAFFTFPVFMMMVASAVGLASANDPTSWSAIFAIFIIVKVASLPVLYTIRPPYAIIGMMVFLQTSVGMILLTMYMTARVHNASSATDSTTVDTTNDEAVIQSGDSPQPILEKYIAISLAPFLTTSFLLKYIRKHLHNIWDTCLVIRPELKRWKYNPMLAVTCGQWLEDAHEQLRSWWAGE